jgi:hypothetical protein
MSLKIRYVQEVGTQAKFMPEAMATVQAKSFAERMKARVRGERPSYGEQAPPPDDFFGGPPRGDDPF